MTKKERLFRMLCMDSDSGGGDKPWEEMTWDEVIAATKNGTYKNFEIGAMKELDLGTEGIVHMQIVGIDADDLADGSGKASLTFISKELLNGAQKMNSTKTSEGGWETSLMRTYLKETVKPLLPASIVAELKEVTKYSKSINPSNKDAETTDDLWIPSGKEIFGGANYESSGRFYSGVFIDSNSRQKFKVEASSSSAWWVRSASNTTNFVIVDASGVASGVSANYSRSIALGFCL